MKRYWKTCLYCSKQFKGGYGPLVCPRCEKTAKHGPLAPRPFTNGPAAVEARRAELQSRNTQQGA